jgi:hypothetical protein
MLRVGGIGVGSLGVVPDGLSWLIEIERRGLAENFEVVLKERGISSLSGTKSGAGLDFDGNLLAVAHLAPEVGISGGAGSTNSVDEVPDCLLDRTKANGCGVRPVLSVLSLVANFHSSSHAGNM